MIQLKQKKVAVIVAHPDDETLWAGGTIVSHNDWDCYIVSLCRANDLDRSKKFYKALQLLNAKGIMGNLNDGPKQLPLKQDVVEKWILKLLTKEHFDIIITHNPVGEYTRNLRHEEVGKAVINLWNNGSIATSQLWVFAYEDGNKKYYPKPVENANFFIQLSKDLWAKKYNIIAKIYGFDPKSWEAETTPDSEAFWQFALASKAKKWLDSLLKH